MLHAIHPEQHGPLGEAMAHAVQACVHCGFCLSVCPTYAELREEMDSPRGRIVLMKLVLEGSLGWESAQPHIDRCLGCLACEPACPSGVAYRDLISPFRTLAAGKFRRSGADKLRHWLAGQTIPYPSRFRLAVRAAGAGRAMRPLVPAALRSMLDLAPPCVPSAQTWPSVTPARGERRARVALLTGCAQQVLDPDINTATIEVLSRNGVEVLVPGAQSCCGGLAWHTGDWDAARAFARRNLTAFPADVDAIVTNAAGCGSAMREYQLILRGTPEEAMAEAFSKRVVDVSVFLARLGLRERPPSNGRPQRIAYHDACHLAQAQNVRREPRDLLRAIPGVQLLELPDPHICCGSAGSYNLDQPAIASALGEKKAKSVLATGAEMLATGNIGCLTQLRAHFAKLGSNLPVRHTIQVLRDAYTSPPPRS
ncbi:MAG TPA: heterodisulfide reductase-related iron-sulfur binding cluster [Candidatus Paceibacterota bacterium]|nr:heterodisulfide reductase-related iron-sulfur binding cluster [Verrucomicrobiota bacterium]HSA09548.1 heterodisulfide reductase-related iron-sulfur binding cluster [Candidatus Paceibacterota bacterium]